MSLTDQFEFTASPATGARVVIDGTIATKRALLSRIADELSFPDYFGENWDALIDCLSDLTWIDDREIVIDHAEIPRLSSDELTDYLSSLGHAAARRTPDRLPRLRLVFRSRDRAKVTQLVG
jgi:RNAse (barnase) inhibitor barstar